MGETITLTNEELAQLMSKPKEKLCRAEFYYEPVEKRSAAGEIYFEDAEMVKIWIDSKSILCRPVTDEHRADYFIQYKRFKETGQNRPDGMPLTSWPGATAGQIKTLELRQIFTVEQLAAAKAADLEFLGGNELKARAIAYLKAKSDTGAAEGYAAVALNLKEQKADLEKQLGDRDAQISKLMERLTALESGRTGELEDRPKKKMAA